MTTARSIIEQAARKIHVLGRGIALSAEEASDALTTLNNFLGTFSAESGTIFNNQRETFTMTGATSYTIGSGGTLNTTRPIVINTMFIRVGSTDYPVAPMNADEYAAIPFKGIFGVPERCYYENNSPLGTLFFDLVPVAGYVLNLWSLKPLTQFADLTTDYDLPDGVENMLVWNLAIRIASDYEKEPTPFQILQAKQTKSAIEVFCRRNNYPKSTIDIGGASDGNIFSGWLTR